MWEVVTWWLQGQVFRRQLVTITKVFSIVNFDSKFWYISLSKILDWNLICFDLWQRDFIFIIQVSSVNLQDKKFIHFSNQYRTAVGSFSF